MAFTVRIIHFYHFQQKKNLIVHLIHPLCSDLICEVMGLDVKKNCVSIIKSAVRQGKRTNVPATDAVKMEKRD